MASFDDIVNERKRFSTGGAGDSTGSSFDDVISKRTGGRVTPTYFDSRKDEEETKVYGETQAKIDAKTDFISSAVDKTPFSQKKFHKTIAGQEERKIYGETQDRIREKANEHRGDFEAGVGAGISGIKSLTGGAVGLVGQAVDSERMEEYGYGVYSRNEEETQKFAAGKTTSLEDIGGVGEAVDWAQYQLGNLAPSMVESLIAGAIGAVVGSTAPGAGTVIGGVGGFVAKGAVKKFIGQQVKKGVAKGLTKKVAEKQAKKSLEKKVGAGMGMFTSSYITGLGDHYGETLDENKKADIATSFIGSIPYAAVDALADMTLLGKVFKGKQAGNVVKRFVGAFSEGAVLEGTQEAIQEGELIISGLISGKKYTMNEVLSRLANSFAAAGIGGGVMGLPGGRKVSTNDKKQPKKEEDVFETYEQEKQQKWQEKKMQESKPEPTEQLEISEESQAVFKDIAKDIDKMDIKTEKDITKKIGTKLEGLPVAETSEFIAQLSDMQDNMTDKTEKQEMQVFIDKISNIRDDKRKTSIESTKKLLETGDLGVVMKDLPEARQKEVVGTVKDISKTDSKYKESAEKIVEKVDKKAVEQATLKEKKTELLAEKAKVETREEKKAIQNKIDDIDTVRERVYEDKKAKPSKKVDVGKLIADKKKSTEKLVATKKPSKQAKVSEQSKLKKEAKKYETADEFIQVKAEGLGAIEQGKYFDIWKEANKEKQEKEKKAKIAEKSKTRKTIKESKKKREETILKADKEKGEAKLKVEIVSIDKKLDTIYEKGADTKYSATGKITSQSAKTQAGVDVLLSRKFEIEKSLKTIKKEKPLFDISNEDVDTIMDIKEVQEAIEDIQKNLDPRLARSLVFKVVQKIIYEDGGKQSFAGGQFNPITSVIDIATNIKKEKILEAVAHEPAHGAFMLMNEQELKAVDTFFEETTLERKHEIFGKNDDGESRYELYVELYKGNEKLLAEELFVTYAAQEYLRGNLKQANTSQGEAITKIHKFFDEVVALFNEIAQKMGVKKVTIEEIMTDIYNGKSTRFEGRDINLLRLNVYDNVKTKLISSEITKRGNEVAEITKELTEINTEKRSIRQNFLQSMEGQKLIVEHTASQEFVQDINPNVLQGIKNHPSYRKEGEVTDDMADGYLMERNGRYVVSGRNGLTELQGRGYTDVISIDVLANEAGFDNTLEYLEQQESFVEEKTLNQVINDTLMEESDQFIEDDTTKGAIKSYDYATLTQKAQTLHTERLALYEDTSSFKIGQQAMKKLKNEVIKNIREKAKVKKDEVKKDEVKQEFRKKIQTLSDRREMLNTVQKHFNLSEMEMKRIKVQEDGKEINLTPNIQGMSNDEFKTYLDELYVKAQIENELSEKAEQAKFLIWDKELNRVKSLQKAMKLPTLRSMTENELDSFIAVLEKAEKHDIFLTQRQLETMKNTSHPDVKTLREIRERYGIGNDVIDFKKLKMTKVMSDTVLARQHPIFNMWVDTHNANMMDSDKVYLATEKETIDLMKDARKSRKKNWKDLFTKEDKLIFDYLESEDKSSVLKEMTDAEIKVAKHMEEKLAQMRDYLTENEFLNEGYIKDYMTHTRKGFLEKWRSSSFVDAVKETWEQQDEDEAVFNIISDTGEILALEKFASFLLHRGDESIDYSENAQKVFLEYVRTFETKRALDATMPVLDAIVIGATPANMTDGGLTMDRSLKTFYNEWMNTKKGRKIDYMSIAQGSKIDRALKTMTAVVAFKYLAGAYAVQVAAFGGEQAMTYVSLGGIKYVKGMKRINTKKGKKIMENYKNFIGKSIREEFKSRDSILGKADVVLFAGFSTSSLLANKQFLLGSLTQKEYITGNISTERLAELKKELGRWRVTEGAKSVIGSTSVVGMAMQFKSWAVPIVNTISSNVFAIAKGKSTKQQRHEMSRVLVTIAVASLVAMAVGDDDDNPLKRKVVRDLFTALGAIDPKMWFSVANPPAVNEIVSLYNAIVELVTVQKYKTSRKGSYKKGELKGVRKIKSKLTPTAIKQFQ